MSEQLVIDEQTKEYVKRKEDELSGLDKRAHSEDDKEEREPFSRDYARIIYSSSFRRLQGKMQLLGVDHLNFFRNRLTHSLEVSQIARSIASLLNMGTTLVVESCSLAHDLGNPPFGHHGERVLDKLANGIGGFEGNAQTLRILTTLEKKHHNYRGLNLTFRTLMGVIKYHPTTSVRKGKKIYLEDLKFIQEKIIDGFGFKMIKSIDMQIMDLADEIAYAAHDLEDCLSIGYFTIDELLYEFEKSEEYNSAFDILNEITNECLKFARKASNLNTSEEFSFLFRKELTSRIVDKLIRDIYYSKEVKRLCFKNYEKLASGLKDLVFQSVLRKRSIQMYEKMGEQVIIGLYEVYTDELYNNGLKLLPPEYRNTEDTERSIVDYIAGMMDSYAVQQYKRHFGENSLDGLYDISKKRSR